MNALITTLWDLLDPRPRKKPARRAARVRRPNGPGPTRTPSPRQARYDALVSDMKRTWGIRIGKWRSRTSGCAWEVRGADGSCTRMIESPYPRGPMSCAVFLHEVGHHAIGFGQRRLRCMEEHLAWEWAIREMAARGFNVTDRVRHRRAQAMRYALRKAIRRGLRRVPEELVRWMPPEYAQTSRNGA